ncbi:MAG: hypothetical protein M3468_13730 [Acidobacteriota bacterium]|nr:hypothetical protein [Acidobacteriota bacterium]
MAFLEIYIGHFLVRPAGIGATDSNPTPAVSPDALTSPAGGVTRIRRDTVDISS